MLENLSMQESKSAIDSKMTFFKQRMNDGHREYGQRSGLSAPGEENDTEIVSFYESPGGAARFGVASKHRQDSASFAEFEKNILERVQWLVSNGESDKRTTVRSQRMFGGRQTVVVDLISPLRSSRSYHVFIAENPNIAAYLWVIRFTADTDERWLVDFLKSVEIVVSSGHMSHTNDSISAATEDSASVSKSLGTLQMRYLFQTTGSSRNENRQGRSCSKSDICWIRSLRIESG